jgi:acetyl-CoA carboxylase biotin carboxyl carrier protein
LKEAPVAEREVLSPLPGIFYRRPAPDQPPYLEEGDAVEEGDTLGLIEVMKTFNEVQADASGKVLRFLVENEDAVESGQALAVIETDEA